MEDGAAALHAAVVPAPYDLAAVDDDRPDRDAALVAAVHGFGDCGVEEGVRRHAYGLMFSTGFFAIRSAAMACSRVTDGNDFRKTSSGSPASK